MNLPRLLIGVFIVVLVSLPLALRRSAPGVAKGVPSIVVITPHNEQIRHEFGRAFARWHERVHGTPAAVVWSTPGGTSEIRRMLVASVESDLSSGKPVGGDADLLFGGGSYEFDLLSKPISVTVDGEQRSATVLEPVVLPEGFLNMAYGDNDIAGNKLYAPDGAWYGAALSSFGMVYNGRLLEPLGVPAPARWQDLADPRLAGWVAMVNPSQSGSVATAFETILRRCGWQDGWRILRRAAANARTIAASSSRIPVDVADGEAAVGVCIDFYGRFEAQALIDDARRAGKEPDGRLAFVDPVGETAIDADPVAMLRGAPNPELARRFIEFCISDDAQALWQLPRGYSGRIDGPEQYELRRLPATRRFIGRFVTETIDGIDPFEVAAPLSKDSTMRSFIAPLFSGLCIDHHKALRAMWRSIIEHPAYPKPKPGEHAELVRADDVTDPGLKAMILAFDAMPVLPAPGGTTLALWDPANLATLKTGWLKGEWKAEGLWPAGTSPAIDLRRRCAAMVAEQAGLMDQASAR
jgi:ABC-type Fe3+ transport system substrate-binding protein